MISRSPELGRPEAAQAAFAPGASSPQGRNPFDPPAAKTGKKFHFRRSEISMLKGKVEVRLVTRRNLEV